jgi:peptidoglycan/xylan/chitin deacetylase (PgdA/CDA1 family)
MKKIFVYKPYSKIAMSSLLICILSLSIFQLPPASFSQSETTAIAIPTIGPKTATTTTHSPIPKEVILTFDDNWKSQFTNARPILDKYGFKATFFVICNYVGRDNNTRMNWPDVLMLQQEGHDIESHTMNHKNLNKLPANKLDYEVGQSKECLHSHGLIATIMATPYNEGWNNATVTNSIAKYYSAARSGNADVMFLHCDKWLSSQNDCRTYFSNGTLTFANRYSIRAWSHNFYDNIYSHNQTSIFDKFIQVVNKQTRYNVEGTIDAIPIIEYHNIDNQNTPYTTSIDLFTAEMKYLHDSGFRVLPMSDLGYNGTTNFLYLRDR